MLNDKKNEERYFIAIDFETGGGDNKKHAITEFGIAIIKNFKIIDSFGSLVYPIGLVEPKMLEYSNIDEKKLMKCKFTLQNMVDILIETVKELNPTGNKYKYPCLVAHNGGFDYGFLEQAFLKCGKNYKDYFGWLYFDTLEQTDLIFFKDIKLKNKKLGTVCSYLNIPTGLSHSAEDDAVACGLLFIKYLRYYSENLNKAKLLEL